ncbi:MAG: hypothetical protein U0793_17500 [Gemmataceae bacterium]
MQTLPYEERLWLIERLAHGLRRSARNARSLDLALAEMAEDPEIQRELSAIAEEFGPLPCG